MDIKNCGLMDRKQQLISYVAAFIFIFMLDTEAANSQSVPPGEGEASHECEETITWRFGSIDPRFTFDQASLKTVVQQVSSLWSAADGYPVIIYDPGGDVELNFYYTDQQNYTDNEQELSGKIRRLRQIYYSQNVMYQRQERLFENDELLFNKMQSEYNSAVNEYNQTLDRIQTAGVRSRDLDVKLKRLERDVDMKESELETMRQNLLDREQELHALSDELNQQADSVNELMYQYQKRFSSWRTFYQGVYLNVAGKRKINIYQFDNIGRLKLVLAHEFGHALGIDHVGNPNSVMYYLTDRQDTRNLRLSEEDIRALQSRCSL
jgi:predicted Zn-dependent protease